MRFARVPPSVLRSTSSWVRVENGVVDTGLDDKIVSAAEDAKGKVKEAVGDVTGNERLEAEGRKDQASSSVKQAGEHVKDAFR